MKGVKGNIKWVSTRFAAAAVAATVIGTAGVALAALPGAASGTAAAALAKHGVTVPGPNAHAGTHPDGPATTTGGGTSTPSGDASTTSGKGKGSVVSQLATTTTANGIAKGAEICTLASAGKCQAGQHGKAGDPHGKAGDPHGKAGDPHGKAGDPHGKAGDPHGKAGDPHGKAGQHGNGGGGLTAAPIGHTP